MAKQYDLQLRMLLIGDSGVGKTCLICRYVDNAFFPSYAATIGIDFKVKNMTVDGKRIRIQVWDTAGQERFETITKQYYRRAQGVILVYDITNEVSFRHVQKWLHYVKEYAADNVEITLIGNKVDLSEKRQVARQDALEFAQRNGFAFFETSAYTDDQISLIYEDLVRRILTSQALDLARQQIDSTPSEADNDSEYITSLLRSSERKQCCSPSGI